MTDVDQVALDQSLDQAFRPGQLRFCHDASYPLTYWDRSLCSLSDAELQRCPAFKRACSAAKDAPARPAAQPKSVNQGTSAMPVWLGAGAEIAFWALMAALVAAVIVALLRMRRSRREGAEELEGPSSLPPPATATEAETAPGDRDVSRLLDKARRAAERGELGEAIDAAHAAAVQGLSAAGHVELELDRTNGDYLRDLRKEPALQREFRVIVGEVEQAQFGGAVPTRGAYERVFEQVSALLRRVAVLALFGLTLALAGCGGPAAEADELSPSGLYTLRRVLGDQGSKVHTRLSPLTQLDANVAEVILLGAELEPPQRAELLRWVRHGGSLVVVESSDFMDVGEVAPVHRGCGHHAERGPSTELVPLTLAVVGERALRPTASPESVVTQRVDATCGGAPYIVTSFLGDGRISFLPERALLGNASLSVADNARLVAELMSTPGRTVELLGPWTGEGSQSPVQSMKSAGMLPVMAQLFGLALLLALRQGTSFGARRDERKLERRAFSDHVRALASNYARAGAGRLASAQYGLLLLEQLRERACPGQSPALLELGAVVARRVQRPEAEIVALLVDAKTGFEDSGDGAGDNQALIRELERLSLQLGGIS